MQKKLPLINSKHGSETRNIINELIKLFNGMGYTYNESLQKAHDILDEAQQTNDMNESVQQQINTLIAESGTSDAEVLQARIDADGNEYPLLKDRLDESDAQLVETSSKIELSKIELYKTKATLRKEKEQSTARTPKQDSFNADLNEWEYTDGIAIVDEKMVMQSGTTTHTNIALYNGVADARGIEVTVGTTNPQMTRIAFGQDLQNWMFLSVHASTGLIVLYTVEGGKLGSSVNVPFGQLPVPGDKIKLVLHTQNIQVFHNNELLGTFIVDGNRPNILPSNTPIKAGVAFRYPSDTWQVEDVKVFPNRPKKYIHFSVDDFVHQMKDISDNSTAYNSIFDNPELGFMKQMHDKFGAVFSLFLMYQTNDGTWNLGSMTTKFKEEFRENAHWLRLGFHSYNNLAKYDGSMYTVAEALEHYNLVINSIRSFASTYNLDSVIRTGFFTGSLDVCRAFRDAEFKTKGFLNSDDNRANDMYLNETQRETLEKCDDYFDAEENLYFVRTDFRLDNSQDAVADLEPRLSDINYVGQNDILEIFTHEGYISSTTDRTRNNIKNICEWGIENGYFFDFPMNHIPDC